MAPAPALPADAAPFTTAELESAWHRVLGNRGRPGADGLRVQAFAAHARYLLHQLADELARGSYHPLPLLPMTLVTSKQGEERRRRLLIPTVRDRIVLTAASKRMRFGLEEEFFSSSFAYRTGVGVHAAFRRVAHFRDRGYAWVGESDIVAFFDSVPHDAVRRAVARHVEDAMVRWVIELALAQRVWTGRAFVPLLCGIPQGSPLSPALSNLALTGFDEALTRRRIRLVRYADDFIVLGRSEADARAALAVAADQLAMLGLEAKAAKTRVVSFSEGFVFLGAWFKDRDVWLRWGRERMPARVEGVPPPFGAGLRRALLRSRGAKTSGLRKRRRARTRVSVAAGSRRELGVIDSPSGTGEGMAILYVTAQGAIVRKSGRRVLVERSDEVLLDEPLIRFEAVVLFGQVQVTSHAMSALVDAGLRVAFMSRHGSVRAMVVPESRNRMHLRLAQFARWSAIERRLELARSMVRAKLASSLRVLERLKRSGAAVAPDVRHELVHIGGRVAEAGDVATLLGLEGLAARRYFDALMQANSSGISWPGRKRRPPRDPLNALLSLGYTLLGNEIRGLVAACGLEEGLGFLHAPDEGRPALALDLLEPFRAPIVDRLVLRLVNLRTVRPDGFRRRPEDGALLLGPEGLRAFLAAYEEWMEPSGPGPSEDEVPVARPAYRRIVRQEVLRFMAAIDQDLPWEPMEVPA